MMQNIVKKINETQEKMVYHLFEKKIEKRQKIFERKYKREMDDDELKKYKFNLFTVYTIMLVILFTLLFSVI